MFIKLLSSLMMMIILGLVFLGSSQPMSMVMVMILVTLAYSFLVYMKLMTFWYSFILMLVVISGVMVIFTYMASMTPNEKFEYNMVVMVMFFFLWMEVFLMEWDFDYSSSSLKLWEGSILFMNIYMVTFLMVVMFMVIWLSDWDKGPVMV